MPRFGDQDEKGKISPCEITQGPSEAESGQVKKLWPSSKWSLPPLSENLTKTKQRTSRGQRGKEKRSRQQEAKKNFGEDQTSFPKSTTGGGDPTGLGGKGLCTPKLKGNKQRMQQ